MWSPFLIIYFASTRLNYVIERLTLSSCPQNIILYKKCKIYDVKIYIKYKVNDGKIHNKYEIYYAKICIKQNIYGAKFFCIKYNIYDDKNLY